MKRIIIHWTAGAHSNHMTEANQSSVFWIEPC